MFAVMSLINVSNILSLGGGLAVGRWNLDLRFTVCFHVGQRSLASLQVAKSSTCFCLGKDGILTTAGWQLSNTVVHMASAACDFEFESFVVDLAVEF